MTRLEAIGNGVRGDETEIVLTCSIANSSLTTDDLPGPGRTLGKLYDAAGTRLEVFLGKVAVRMGKGPLATANRIRRNREKMICMTTHFGRCHCDVRMPKSAQALRKSHEEISKDCGRLVRYIKSREYSTRKQAVESVLDLAIWDGELRAILNAKGSGRAISDLLIASRTFHAIDRGEDDVLLQRSRKALLSLDNTRLSVLLGSWSSMLDALLGTKGMLDGLWQWPESFNVIGSELCTSWHRIAIYLLAPDFAFIILRFLRRSVRRVLDTGLPAVTAHILGSIRCSSGCFEWTECEEILCAIFSKINDRNFLDIMADWVLRNANRIPRIFEATSLGLLLKDINELDCADIPIRSSLQSALLSGIRGSIGLDPKAVPLESKYTWKQLQPLLKSLGCAVSEMVASFPEDHTRFSTVVSGYNFQGYRHYHEPDDKERLFLRQLVQHGQSSDPFTRGTAWAYIDYFLKHDIYRQKLLLDSLAQSSYLPPEDLLSFLEEKRIECVPNLGARSGQMLYCRQRDNNGNIHYHDLYNVPCACNESDVTEILGIPFEWIMFTTVRRGEAFSAAENNPLVVECDAHDNRKFIARIHPVTASCRDIRSCHSVYTTIRDGTRPEDLRVELVCPHRKALAIPDAFSVTVLRYAPEAYVKFLGIDTESSYTSKLFPWMPAKCRLEPCACGSQMRALSIEEARNHGYSEEEIFPDNSNGSPTCHLLTQFGVIRHVDTEPFMFSEHQRDCQLCPLVFSICL